MKLGDMIRKAVREKDLAMICELADSMRLRGLSYHATWQMFEHCTGMNQEDFEDYMVRCDLYHGRKSR